MCVEGLRSLLAQCGIVSGFGVDGSVTLSSQPVAPVLPPTDDDLARLLDQPPPKPGRA